MAARTLALAAELLARSRKLRYEGTAIANRMPRMMMTTRSSMRVKPLSSPASRCRILLIMRGAPSMGAYERVVRIHRLDHSARVTPERVKAETTKGAVSGALHPTALPALAGEVLDR